MSDQDRATVVELADLLWRAEVDRTPIDPITATRADLTLADAYAIQAYNVRRRVEAGRAIRGFRLGRTSQPRQEILGVSQPDFGMLIDDMFVENGDEVPAGSLLQPRVVVEIAFVMGHDLAGPGATTADALTAIAGVLPVIEIVDSRIADWRVQLADTVADNASAGKVVLGSRMMPATAVDLRLAGMLLHRNGSPVESAAGAAALGNPVRCLAWLANRLLPPQRGLRGGDIVLSGPLHRLVPVRPNDVYEVEFAHLGTVTVGFGAEGAAA
ncbi:2-keto-4-pentenoate hydratase [Mycobacterium sp. URHB0021]|jgi:2-keto-4-pentenoate hydratase